MEIKETNILNFLDPIECTCSLIGYMVKEYPYLVIEIMDSKGNYSFVNFIDVHYIDISEFWIGANFGLATKAELSQLLKSADLDNTDSLQLYCCPVEPNQERWVKIIAREITIMPEAPDYYRGWVGIRD